MSRWAPSDLPEFDKWWEEHGQFLRAGGGDYERTFAYEAMKFALTKDKSVAELEEAKKLHYFVTYHFVSANGSGKGCMDISRSNPIRNWDDVDGLGAFIAEYKGFETVVLLNWRRYEEED